MLIIELIGPIGLTRTDTDDGQARRPAPTTPAQIWLAAMPRYGSPCDRKFLREKRRCI